MERSTKAPTKLWRWRAHHDLSQEELADLVGVSPVFVSRLERGLRNASPTMKVQIARRLGVRVADLFEVDPIDAEVAAS